MCAEVCLSRALVVSALVWLGGCSGVAGSRRTLTLEASPHPFVADIPVPEGFRLAEQSSEDWTVGPIRYLRHRYEGRADKYAVRRFYREQMPLVRWAAISDGNIQGRHTMRFERGTEQCTVYIDSPASWRSGRVIVDVVISPAGH